MLKRVLAQVFHLDRSPHPKDAHALADLVSRAQAEAEAGRFDAARTLIEPTLSRHPEWLPGLRLLGAVLGQAGEFDAAARVLERAARLAWTDSSTHNDLGNVLRLKGDAAGAQVCYRRALELDPELESARLGLVFIADRDGRRDEALALLEPLISGIPSLSVFQEAIAILDRNGAHARAIALCERMLHLDSEDAHAHASLGFLLLKRELDAAAAIGHFERAIALGAGDAEVYANRGIALQDLGRIGDALDSYDAALRLDPRSHVAAFHRGLARLLEGDFERGWPDYEGRLLSDRHPRRNMPFASWHGENPSGRTVLAYAEQGIGDEIMFASCLPELIARAGHVIIDCAPKLAPLFARSFPQATVHGGSQFDDIDWLDALQEPDLAVPVGSLPLYLRPTPGAFPPHSGYLVADSARVRHYRETLARLGPGLKIGLSWRGGTALSRKDQRSLDPAQLAPLFRIEALHFVNLQYDTRPQELASFSPWGQVHDIAEANASFDETAALVAALDGVVSVCTAVIHLSGALGRPVWILAPFSPEWRYGIRGERMPWYPSARVLRQRSRGDWSEPLAEVVARVSAAAKASSPHSGGISPC